MESSGLVETVLPTEDIPPEERFAFWHELIWNSFAPTDWSSDHADQFHVKHRMLGIGDVQIWEASLSTSKFVRTEKLIRQSDPEKVCIAINRRGVLLGDTADRQAVCKPGYLYCHDTSHPGESVFRAPQDQGAFDGISIMAPKKDLSLSRRKIDKAVGLQIRADDGVGALLSTFVTQLVQKTTSFRRTDGSRLGLIVCDLISAMLAGILDDLGSVSEKSRRNVLVLRIKEFMINNLSDPELTPSVVAAAHHISVSYLHRIFQSEENSVAAWIRQRRMENACADLADAAQHTVPIQTIAARWGFPRAAEFTRAFRMAHGTTPTEYRQQHISRELGSSPLLPD